MAKPTLKFYDLRKRKAFSTPVYKLLTKSGRNFAVAKNSSGKDSYLIVSKDFMKKWK